MTDVTIEIPRRLNDPPRMFWWDLDVSLLVQACHSLAEAHALLAELPAFLRRLRDDAGKCIVFSTHIMQEVVRLCDHVVLVSRGRSVAAGSVAELNALSGREDFEESFVKLAYGSEAIANLQAG